MNLKHAYNTYLNKTSVKVALTITVLMVVLFVLMDILVIYRGQSTFNDIYQFIEARGGNIPRDDVPFFAPAPSRSFPFVIQGPNRALTVSQHFTARFQASMIIIGIIALLGVAGIGYLTFRIIKRPLNKLSNGLKTLRDSHYTRRLKEDESEEFNAVIREFNSLAAELQRVEELRRNLITDASHELRTPLASLQAQLEGIQDGVLKIDPERLALLQTQVARLHELTNGMQDYAYLRSQALRLQRTATHLRELVDKITASFKEKIQHNKITVHNDVPADYTIDADPALLERIFNNLMENSIRYSQATHITVSASGKNFSFSDNGVGIPPEHLHNIFERFFRLDKSRSRASGGMGLGLSIVKEIVEAHGWHIQAETPADGHGVEFRVTFLPDSKVTGL
ncbi:MAG: ATP-binding protein [Patescibacteria group bacterium]